MFFGVSQNYVFYGLYVVDHGVVTERDLVGHIVLHTFNRCEALDQVGVHGCHVHVQLVDSVPNDLEVFASAFATATSRSACALAIEASF